jgi:hypothetical protein
VCLKNIHRAENASFGTCFSRLFRAINPIIPQKRALSQNPKSAIFISGNVFQTHSRVCLNHFKKKLYQQSTLFMLNSIDGPGILAKALKRDANGFFHYEKQYEYVEWQSNSSSSHWDIILTSDITQKLAKKLFKETPGNFKKEPLTNKAWDILHQLGDHPPYEKTDSHACMSLYNLRCYIRGYL